MNNKNEKFIERIFSILHSSIENKKEHLEIILEEVRYDEFIKTITSLKERGAIQKKRHQET